MRHLSLIVVLLLSACSLAPTERIVEREVEVTRMVTVEVTREVEVTRIVPVEVTRVVQVTVLVGAGNSAEATPAADARPRSGSGCYTWDEAAAHIGEEACVEGFVTGTYDSGRAFFINFDPVPGTFYAVAFDYKFPDIEGTCVRISGKIETYKGRPQIVIRDPDRQMASC